MIENNKFRRVACLLIVAYVIIWFWPVVFHRPFFDGAHNIPIDIVQYGGPVQIQKIDFGQSGSVGYGSTDAPIDLEPIYFPEETPPTSVDPVEPVACTMEAKQCPDGTYVGRQGPNCEFAACPGN